MAVVRDEESGGEDSGEGAAVGGDAGGGLGQERGGARGVGPWPMPSITAAPTAPVDIR
ncbi:hypothetical protein [Streptomyces sp. CBG31]|uniref:hypothetical protein n=1 Tax=Streptomyces sp. CBG31 TaxID=2762623 RepID=UPI0021BD46B8|nr:hypothetical protein [Streptomyces sp. CBG31]